LTAGCFAVIVLVNVVLLRARLSAKKDARSTARCDA
jgi:hypothetical protein